ncbi:MAG: hypothetical protein CTY19_01130 [Methylomonas sp.]|nr:MAG: hypothetical protein CTY19_01130 [Methylomonas sp.]
MRNCMADNRVVIKINYDKDKQRKELIDPKMVTVWHVRRIYSAVAILLLLVALFVLWIYPENDDEKTLKPTLIINGNTGDDAAAVHQVASERVVDKSEASQTQIDTKKPLIVKRPAAIIYDRQVVRAALTTEPKKNEPGEAVNLPVSIVQNQILELFYFSQIKNPKSSILFHRWYKNGQLIFKKQFEVKKDHATLISSKKFTSKDIGDWQVLLVDKNGKSLSEINYSVNQ